MKSCHFFTFFFLVILWNNRTTSSTVDIKLDEFMKERQETLKHCSGCHWCCSGDPDAKERHRLNSSPPKDYADYKARHLGSGWDFEDLKVTIQRHYFATADSEDRLEELWDFSTGWQEFVRNGTLDLE